MSPRITLAMGALTARLATLERQRQRYVAGWATMPPPRSPASAKARVTRRRWVLRQNLRKQRALLLHGHERGWRQVALTPEDQAQVETMLEQREGERHAGR